jgi:hypothetical protein
MKDWQLLSLSQEGEKEGKKKIKADRLNYLIVSVAQFTRININTGTYEAVTIELVSDLTK